MINVVFTTFWKTAFRKQISVFLLECRVNTVFSLPNNKMKKSKRGNQKSCANALHELWGSLSQDLVCMEKRVKDYGIFLKAFDLRRTSTRWTYICKDCLKNCWTVPAYTSKLPTNYIILQGYTMVRIFYLWYSCFVLRFPVYNKCTKVGAAKLFIFDKKMFTIKSHYMGWVKI